MSEPQRGEEAAVPLAAVVPHPAAPDLPPRTTPADLALGHRTPVFEPHELLKTIQPEGALARIVQLLREHRGTKGRKVHTIELVTDDGEWTELRVPRPPEVIRRRRRGQAEGMW